ncbi:hypothetical protein Mal15_31890 [Stieleria maiorica]|uniref:Uncharacterized protein n=1 Tax=Stieleria maiorica TaxID=2795974 RepID=A0A5B9MF35_9BACT|nr:hypothetical protein Mal15_31890 [Stieleria maiorica]
MAPNVENVSSVRSVGSIPARGVSQWQGLGGFCHGPFADRPVESISRITRAQCHPLSEPTALAAANLGFPFELSEPTALAAGLGLTFELYEPTALAAGLGLTFETCKARG